MALEAVHIFQQDPNFTYGYKDYNNSYNIMEYCFGYGDGQVLQEDQKPNVEGLDNSVMINGDNWESPPPSHHNYNTTSSSTDGFYGGGVYNSPEPVKASRRKRRRNKSVKNKVEMEEQRMTHIAVERNRRRQMNEYLAVLRSMMPTSYSQRGDQASIVGGAINYVKELEQFLQFLEAHKPSNQEPPPQPNATPPKLFSNFFTFPQYSTTCPNYSPTAAATDMATERRSTIADVEVTMAESHANIKILVKRRPKQLLKIVAGIQSICLTILHLNVTTIDPSVLYSFSVKVEDECQMSTVNEIATAVHDMMRMIHQD